MSLLFVGTQILSYRRWWQHLNPQGSSDLSWFRKIQKRHDCLRKTNGNTSSPQSSPESIQDDLCQIQKTSNASFFTPRHLVQSNKCVYLKAQNVRTFLTKTKTFFSYHVSSLQPILVKTTSDSGSSHRALTTCSEIFQSFPLFWRWILTQPTHEIIKKNLTFQVYSFSDRSPAVVKVQAGRFIPSRTKAMTCGWKMANIGEYRLFKWKIPMLGINSSHL